jgi:hypothetical protein
MPAKTTKPKAKAAELVTSEVTDQHPQDPSWDNARAALLTLRRTGRTYVYLQAWFGWHLATKKAEHRAAGGGRGGDRKSKSQVSPLIPWGEKVLAETGLPQRTADRFILLHEAFKTKLKRVAGKAKKGSKEALALSLFENANPLALPTEKLEQLQEIAASLCDGDTQGSLMQELGIVPEPKTITQAAKSAQKEPPADEQTAFAFWRSHATAIVDARSSGVKALYLLPVESDDPEKPGLRFLQAETAALLQEIESAIATHAKPAKAKH